MKDLILNSTNEKVVSTIAVTPIDINIYEEDLTRIANIVNKIGVFVEINNGLKNYTLMYRDLGSSGVEDFRLYDSKGVNDDANSYILDVDGIKPTHQWYSKRFTELSNRYLASAREVLVIKVIEVTIISLLLKECGLKGSEMLVDSDHNAKIADKWVEDILHNLSDDVLNNIEAVTTGTELKESLSDVIEQINLMNDITQKVKRGEIIVTRGIAVEKTRAGARHTLH